MDVPADGKLDSFRNPTDHGDLDLREGTAHRAEIKAREWFHVWNFKLSGSASMSIETRPARTIAKVSNPSDRRPFAVDTVMYVYKQRSDGGWGRYIARNDDNGDSVFSLIEDDWTEGTYRVLVKGYRRDDVGPFHLHATCTGPGCRAGEKHCVFGGTLTAFEHSANLEETNRRTYEFDRPDTMTSEEAAGVLHALSVILEQEFGSLEEVTDYLGGEEDKIYYRHLKDSFSPAEYDAYYIYAAETSSGVILDAANGNKVAAIGDDDIFGCNVFEPEDRWDSLAAMDVDTPSPFAGLEADAPAPDHVHITGMMSGDWLSDGALSSVLDAVVAADPNNYGCSGLPLGSDADFSDRMEGRNLIRLLTNESWNGWEMGPSAALINALRAYIGSDGEEARIGIYQFGLAGEACGGSGSGTAFMMHDASTQVVSLFVLVEWSE